MSKMLIAYFSASGVTANVAKSLAEVTGGDLYEIKPETPYAQKDLNWMNPLARSTKEMKGKLPYPALADKDLDISGYSTILLGFPIWWYVAPTIINSFLEAYDFSGKKIILFATSGGSGFGKTVEKLRPSVSNTTRIVEGKLLNGNPSAAELTVWVNSITEDM